MARSPGAAESAPASFAPASIASSIINFSWQDGSANWDELVFFRPDGTYQDHVFSKSPLEGGPTVAPPPTSGSYSHSTSPEDSDVGVILANGSSPFAGALFLNNHGVSGGGDMYFSEPNFGFWNVPRDYFQLWPFVTPAGAVNVSTRGLVSAAHPMVAGFVIEGTAIRWVLIRGDGPSLEQFGVTDAVANPQVTVFSGATPYAALSAWSSNPDLVPGYNALFALAGAFPLPSGSADCAGLLLLPPGADTAQGLNGGP